MERWARRLPRLFEEWPLVGQRDNSPALQSFVENGNLVAWVDVPRVDPKDIDVSVFGNVLTVRGTRKEKDEVKSEYGFGDEPCCSSFERRITLPEGANSDKITANFKDGVVQINMPLSVAVVRKTIPLKSIQKTKSSATRRRGCRGSNGATSAVTAPKRRPEDSVKAWL